MTTKVGLLGRMLVAAASATLLIGCMTATPYQPEIRGQAVSGGYSEQRLSANSFRVNFAGNSLTSRDRVEGYLLYRAAELTLQSGFDYFVIVDRLTERDVRTYVEPDRFYRPYYGTAYAYWRPHWRYYEPGIGWTVWHPEWGTPFWAERTNVRTVERFEAHAEIVMHRGSPSPGQDRAFVASAVIADLEPTIQRPE
ncbi:CC0125/CC1285 family lipoprotein [Qipengyuania zhejiangensis]|uniref:CC0125/CC1285 family lipoprotein n=1 Tax=Qipengyuania zhejiangensis TaxID=3077782 RepID=UPI002D77EE68|nr:hypothetical protein [Qipengyuania sp. Z2]